MRTHEFLVALFDESIIPSQYFPHVSASFLDVTLDSPGQGNVKIAYNEDLEVQKVSDSLVMEAQNSFKNDDRVWRKLNFLIGESFVSLKAIVWSVGILAVTQVSEALVHLVKVERVGMVEVVVIGMDSRRDSDEPTRNRSCRPKTQK